MMTSNNIFIVTVPQLGVNDNKATIIDWLIQNEETVTHGDPLVVLETTKAAVEVEAEASGYVIHLAEIGEEVNNSEQIALIGPDLKALRAFKEQQSRKRKIEQATSAERDSEQFASRKAELLAERLGVDLSSIKKKGIIREKDVLKIHRDAQPRAEVVLECCSGKIPVVLYGAGKGAITVKECLDFHPQYQVVCFVDDNPVHPDQLAELPVYDSSQLDVIVAKGVGYCFAAVTNGKIRLEMQERCEKLGLKPLNIVHPRAYVAPSVRMGQGNYIKAGAVVETNTLVGNCCEIDNGVIIAHDTVIGDGCHLAPGAFLGSSIHVDDFSIIGIGASIATGVKIGRETIIAVGTSVVRDVPDRSVIEGVPGKVVGKRK